jgi:uncharacterized protein YjaG (DUF416 family)
MSAIMLRYDEAAAVLELARLSPERRVVYAATCSERLLPLYEGYCRRSGRGNSVAIAEILQRLWQHLLGDEMGVSDIDAALSRCMALIPDEDVEPWIDEQAFADDAVSATAYALETLKSGEPQESAWAGRRAFEAAGYHVSHRLGVESYSDVVAHPVVQRELSRQRRDLDELLAARQEPPELVVRLRDRARTEAATFFAP